MIDRRALLAAALGLCAHGAHAQQPSLAERRAIAAYREGPYPALEAAIREAAGFDVPVEVAWDELAVPGDAAYYADERYFGKTIFEPLAAGLRAVARDPIGREAVRGKLQRIRIGYDPRTAIGQSYVAGLRFQDGVLSVNWRPFANTDEFEPRVKAVVQVLEKNL